MRRPTVFGLIGLVFVILVGAYTAFWWIAAGKIEDAVTQWRETARAQKLDAAWQSMRVSGYPFAFRLELTGAQLKDTATIPAAELQAATLSASVRPWNFHAVDFDAPDGVSAALGPVGVPFARVSAERGNGAVAFGDDGRMTIWLSLFEAKGGAGIEVKAHVLQAWAILPPQTARAQRETNYAFALSLHDLAPPLVPSGFKNTIDELGFGVTLRGAFPSGPLAQAAAKWRDDGGTLELDHLQLRWGDIQATASGTLALGPDMQPVASISGGVEGYDQLLNGLVGAGRIKGSDARMARLALAMMAKPGPGGRAEIAASLRIQDGEMFLGPVRLGPAPRIDW